MNWDIFWASVIAVLAILDAVLAKLNVKDTLSYQIWRAEGITQSTGSWSLTRFVVLVFLVWAILHLVFHKVG